MARTAADTNEAFEEKTLAILSRIVLGGYKGVKRHPKTGKWHLATRPCEGVDPDGPDISLEDSQALDCLYNNGGIVHFHEGASCYTLSKRARELAGHAD